MPMKLLTLFLTKIPNFPFPKSRSKFATFCSSPEKIESFHSISSNPFLYLLNLCRTLSSVQKIHSLLIVSGEVDRPLLHSKLISLYGMLGDINHARRVFDEMPDPDFATCKVMMRWYFVNDLYNEIIGFYRFMRRRRFWVYDNILFSIVLKACSELRDFGEGRRLHGCVVRNGVADGFVLTGLVDMYAKCGEIDVARKVFEKIGDRNVVCWTSLIVGYVQSNCPKEGLVLFNRMRDCLVEGNSYTFGSIVTACARLGALHQGRWVHGIVIKSGIEVNSHVFTSLLDMYMKCNAIKDARLVFDELSVVDLVSWTAMITGYAQSGFAEEALTLFTHKNWSDISPNSVTLASVLSACAQLGNSALGSSVHSLGIRLGQDDTNVMNALVDMYAKCHRIEDASYLFESIKDKDIISWNSIISGYSQNGYAYKALRLFDSMRSNHIQPDPVTMVAVLSACALLGDIRLGSSFHSYTIRKGFLGSTNVYVGTALLNLYAKCGDIESAHGVFSNMAEKSAATWNALVGGYGKQGNSTKCFELFGDMLKENVEPTDIVFTAILSACSHTGLVGEGWRYFDMMCRSYKFVPSMRHYVSMVDLFARCGQLEEALKFIEEMPVQPDCAVFGAFLHGCNMHSRFDLGDVAVRKMLELHPKDAGHYVLMSNMDVSKGRWSEANQLRGIIKKRGMKKLRGSSQVNLYVNEVYTQRVTAFG